jgi:hypothetical protein
VARRAAAEASAVTPNAGGWLALAEAEYERARGPARPASWSQAAAAWQRLDLAPPPAAFPEEKHGPEESLGLNPARGGGPEPAARVDPADRADR